MKKQLSLALVIASFSVAAAPPAPTEATCTHAKQPCSGSDTSQQSANPHPPKPMTIEQNKNQQNEDYQQLEKELKQEQSERQ